MSLRAYISLSISLAYTLPPLYGVPYCFFPSSFSSVVQRAKPTNDDLRLMDRTLPYSVSLFS